MMQRMLIVSVVVLFVVWAPAFAADIAGKWTSEFDSPIGRQHYIYEFKVDGTTLTGTATQSERGTTDIKEGKINGDDISFVELVTVEGNELRIEHKGKVAGDEIRLRRKVGDFAEYDIIARRSK
jgi:hypothetical protein